LFTTLNILVIYKAWYHFSFVLLLWCMKENRSRVEELIHRFRNNECTPEEIEFLQQWMTQLDVSDETTDLSQQQLDAVKTRMYHHITTGSPVVIAHRGKMIRRYMVAAGWLALISSAILLWYISKQDTSGSHSKKTLLTIIENKRTGIKRIVLPDSTVVCLNTNSRLEFDPQQFNQTQRYVKLSGEGFFEVARDAAKPFIVETGNLRTRVLGTAFNIEAYNHESEIRVSLVHGKIALNDTATDETTLLSPDHTFRYSKQTKTAQVLPVEAASVMLWTKGWLVFNEVPLQEALERISERYNVVIEYNARRLQGKRITATFQAGSYATILENILFVHGLHFRRVATKVIVQ
jgi:transmembrane sensor